MATTGPRAVRITGLFADELKRIRALWAKDRLAKGSNGQEPGGLIFTNSAGGPIHRENFRNRMFIPLLDKLELPRIRIHDLRHSAATILLTEGFPPQVVMMILGHTRIGTTTDIYGHLSVAAQDEAMKAWDKMLK